MRGRGVMPREQINYPKYRGEAPEDAPTPEVLRALAASVINDARHYVPLALPEGGETSWDQWAENSVKFAERVLGRVQEYIHPTPVIESPVSAPTVHVCWHKSDDGGGWAQLLFEVDRVWLEQLLAETLRDERIELHSEVLERSDLNKLIQMARRAREQAYGRDE